MLEKEKQELITSLYYDQRILLLTRNAVKYIYPNEVDHELLIKIFLRKLTTSYGKFLIGKKFDHILEQHQAIFREAKDTKVVKDLIKEIELLNIQRYKEIIEIYLEKRDNSNLLKLINSKDIAKHLAYKYFHREYPEMLETKESIILSIINSLKSGLDINQALDNLSSTHLAETNSVYRILKDTLGIFNEQREEDFYHPEFNLDHRPLEPISAPPLLPNIEANEEFHTPLIGTIGAFMGVSAH